MKTTDRDIIQQIMDEESAMNIDHVVCLLSDYEED